MPRSVHPRPVLRQASCSGPGRHACARSGSGGGPARGFAAALLSTILMLASGAHAQAPRAGDQPVPPLPPQAAAKTELVTRNASLPARGLFDGDKLTAEAEDKLTVLIIDAVGRQVEVALLMPTGPWRVEGGARDERDLTPARLEAIKSFMAARGIDRRRIFVESRVDEKLREPRLDVQIIDRPAND